MLIRAEILRELRELFNVGAICFLVIRGELNRVIRSFFLFRVLIVAGIMADMGCDTVNA